MNPARGQALLDLLAALLLGTLAATAATNLWQLLQRDWLRPLHALRHDQATAAALALLTTAIREADTIAPLPSGFLLGRAIDTAEDTDQTCLGHRPASAHSACRIRLEPGRMLISDDSGASPQAYLSTPDAMLSGHQLRFGVLRPPAALQWLTAEAVDDWSTVVAVELELITRSNNQPSRRWPLRAAIRNRLPVAAPSASACAGLVWPICLIIIAAISGLAIAMLTTVSAELTLTRLAVAQPQAFFAAERQLQQAEQALDGCPAAGAAARLSSVAADPRQTVVVAIEEAIVCRSDSGGEITRQRRRWRQIAAE